MKNEQSMQVAICLDNEGYEVSLDVGGMYQIIPDDEAYTHGYIRVIDESGEDYAFTANRFDILQPLFSVDNFLSSKLRICDDYAKNASVVAE